MLVDFWTLTCINWLRTEPYIRAWWRSVRDDGLIVIGVHTPEFSFEHDVDRVRQATNERRIVYPVAVDNDYAIWTAFDNHYWPALYFVDTEVELAGTNISVRVATRSRSASSSISSASSVRSSLSMAWALRRRLTGTTYERLAETYLGYGHGERFVSPDGAGFDQRHAFELPERIRLNEWALAGTWTVETEKVALEEAGGTIAFRSPATRIS